MLNTFTSEDWLENFRVCKETFLYLYSQLKPAIEKQATRMRSAICVEHGVAVTLLCLASCSEYRLLGHASVWDCSKYSLCESSRHMHAKQLFKHFQLHAYNSFPTGTTLTEVVDGFKEKWDIIQ